MNQLQIVVNAKEIYVLNVVEVIRVNSQDID